MEELKFSEFKEKAGTKEGIVLLGTGGDLKEWTDGIAKMLSDDGISTTSNPDEIFTEQYLLTTTGGRHDLALVVDFSKVNLSKMAIWRLSVGDCSWISDYVVNYANQHFVDSFEQNGCDLEDDD